MGCTTSRHNALLQDVHDIKTLQQRYWESCTAARFTRGERMHRYRAHAQQMKRLMVGEPRERRRYLRDNRTWDVDDVE